MDKTEQVKKWADKTSSYEGCIYVALDKDGNSFGRIHNHKYVSNRQLINRLRQLVSIKRK